MGMDCLMGKWIRLEYESADIPGVLDKIRRWDIPVVDLVSSGEITVCLSVYSDHYPRLNAYAAQRGETVRIIGRSGLMWKFRDLLRRPVLILGLLLLILGSCYLPGRVLLVDVEGNDTVPEQKILESAAKCGVSFGASRRALRSEQVKNYLLDAIPELKWAGVNTYGCRAVITVREREKITESEVSKNVGHIVALRDGVVTEVTVTDGTGQCRIGQAVRKGEILISGYTDCGITIRAGSADGEVYAETKHQISAKTPTYIRFRGNARVEARKYSLILGKKRINFYKGSGISGGTCVKMYSEYVLTLPGGSVLPVILRVESIRDFELYDRPVENAESVLKDFATDYLSCRMIGGSIIGQNEILYKAEENYTLMGEYTCLESIGVWQDEKIGDFHGKTNGTDRERGSGG